ncbi:MAG: hypothetical protein ABUT20_34915 [Bacteroidota bacterium]
MYIQRKIYKYHEKKNNIIKHISGISETSTFKSGWIDENTFILKHKNPLFLFGLEGNIAEMEEKNKLEVAVTADYRYLMLYIIPAAIILYGLFKWSSDSARGLLFTFIGFSASVFIYLFMAVVISNFKKSFKEALDLI